MPAGQPDPMKMVQGIMKSGGMDFHQAAEQARIGQARIAETLELCQLMADEIQAIKDMQSKILAMLEKQKTE